MKRSLPEALAVATRGIERTTLRSPDGAVVFILSRASRGICVERAQERPSLGCIMLKAVFTDAIEFARWCDADLIRFDYPLLYVNVKRHGQAMLQADE
jgi:hypothetical protein